jgi:hypothetical protein
LSFRQFASNDCSGNFQDFVRLISPSMQSAPETCFSFPITSAVQLYYRVTVANPAVSALEYKLPHFGHESMDYDPLTGKIWMGSVYQTDSVYAIDPAGSALKTRPPMFGGVGYAGTEQHPLNSDKFFTDPAVNNLFAGVGMRSIGEQTSKCLKRMRIIKLRPALAFILICTNPFRLCRC